MAGVKPASPARYGRRVPLNPSCACSPTEKAICGILRRSAFSSTAGATSTYQKQSSPAYHLRVIPASARYARYFLLPHAHFFEKISAFPFSVCYHPPVESDFKHQSSRAWMGVASEQRETRSPLESTVQLKTPRGITVEEAAQLLRYSTSTVRRLIAAHILVAWKPGGPAGRKYLIDEISLARWQAESIRRAREEASTTQAALLQGELPLVW